MFISERTAKAHLSSAANKLDMGRVQMARWWSGPICGAAVSRPVVERISHNGNMSEAIIRTLRRDDYPALIDLVRRTWYAEFDERTGLLAAEADWENCLARTTNAFVAELDGQPVA